MRKMVPIMAAALTFGGCSAGADRAKAEAGVAQFHRMMEAGRYHEIYTAAADEFRRTTAEPEGISFLQMVHDRLGAVRSSSATGWRVNFTPGGTMVNLSYNTQFASGAGSEDFVFRIGGANAQLVGYHVNSPALIAGASAGSPGSAKPAEAAVPATPVTAVQSQPAKPAEAEPAGGK